MYPADTLLLGGIVVVAEPLDPLTISNTLPASQYVTVVTLLLLSVKLINPEPDNKNQVS